MHAKRDEGREDRAHAWHRGAPRLACTVAQQVAPHQERQDGREWFTVPNSTVAWRGRDGGEGLSTHSQKDAYALTCDKQTSQQTHSLTFLLFLRGRDERGRPETRATWLQLFLKITKNYYRVYTLINSLRSQKGRGSYSHLVYSTSSRGALPNSNPQMYR